MKYLIAWERVAVLLESHRSLITRTPDLCILGARDSEELFALHREHRARLLVLDVTMPGPAPDEICRRVRADPDLRKVSLIIVGNVLSIPVLKRCAANRSFVRPLNQDDFLGAIRSLINVAARKNFRVLLGVRLTGVVRNVPFFGRSENISATGILFSSSRIMDLGDRPELSMVLPGHGHVHAVAEIMRVEPVLGGDPKYGARFIEPSLQAQQMLDSFIHGRSP